MSFLLLDTRREGDSTQNYVSGPPCLSIEHVEGVKLILHSNVEHLRDGVKRDALVEVSRPQSVIGDESDLIREKREVVKIARAQNYHVDLLAGSIDKVTCFSFHPLEQRLRLPIVGEVKAHWRGSVARGDGGGSIFPALRANVLGRVRGTHNHYILSLVVIGISEIVGVEDSSAKSLDAFEIRNIGS